MDIITDSNPNRAQPTCSCTEKLIGEDFTHPATEFKLGNVKATKQDKIWVTEILLLRWQ